MDHFELNKFRGPEDYYYRLVSDEILKFLDQSLKHRQTLSFGLREAAKQGNTPLARDLIGVGADTHVSTNDGATPLHDASSNGHEDMVRILLDAHIKRDVKRADSTAPSQGVLAKGILEVTKGLLAPSSDLLGLGTELQAKMDNGSTALHDAAFRGQAEVVKLLRRIESRGHERRRVYRAALRYILRIYRSCQTTDQC